MPEYQTGEFEKIDIDQRDVHDLLAVHEPTRVCAPYRMRSGLNHRSNGFALVSLWHDWQFATDTLSQTARLNARPSGLRELMK